MSAGLVLRLTASGYWVRFVLAQAYDLGLRFADEGV